MTRKILFVDDEPNILNGIKRQLHNQFEFDCAVGGAAAIELLRGGEPYAVIVTDMRMPDMNGVQLLIETRRISPNTTRLMLTGNSDLQTAVEAVNRGHVFRFLNKPCSADDLNVAVEAGLEQYRLVTGEKELLSKTLAGSLSLVTELLSTAAPMAFGRGQRIRKWAGAMAQHLNIAAAWEVEIAALVSQIGMLTIPEGISAKVQRRESLTKTEQELYASHAEIGAKLLRRIPRLENVATFVVHQDRRCDEQDLGSQPIPLGARILKVCLDFDALINNGYSYEHALDTLYERQGWYDAAALTALSATAQRNHELIEVFADDLHEDMTLAEHIFSLKGDVLVPAGRQVTPAICARLKAFRANGSGIREPIRVRRQVAAQLAASKST